MTKFVAGVDDSRGRLDSSVSIAEEEEGVQDINASMISWSRSSSLEARLPRRSFNLACRVEQVSFDKLEPEKKTAGLLWLGYVFGKVKCNVSLSFTRTSKRFG
jgi:hypothetical protein